MNACILHLIFAVLFGCFVLSTHAAEYPWFRFTPLVLRDEGAADSVQLSEFELRLEGEAIDLSVATITNPDGDNPTGEEVENVGDQILGTKWLDFNKGAIVFEFPTAIIIDSYRFATAGDEPQRDPVSWKIEGSNDGVDWILLNQRNNYPTPIDRETYTPVFLIAPNQDLAIESFDVSPTVILDGASCNLIWSVFNAESISIAPDPGEVADSGSIEIMPAPGTDTNFVLTATSDTDELNATTVVRSVQGGTTNCRYVRFTPVELRDYQGANSIQLAEFDFFIGVTPVTVASVSNPGGDNPASEIPANLIDGNVGTKWLDFKKGGLVFDFGATVALDAYRFTTAGDAPTRDPLRWTLEGSDDGVVWSLIENMTAFDFPTPIDREQATQVIPLPGPSLQPLAPFAITGSSFDFSNGTLELTFRSQENRSYRVTTSTEASDWSTVLASGIPGEAGEASTMVTVGFPSEERAFFRVEEE